MRGGSVVSGARLRLLSPFPQRRSVVCGEIMKAQMLANGRELEARQFSVSASDKQVAGLGVCLIGVSASFVVIGGSQTDQLRLARPTETWDAIVAHLRCREATHPDCPSQLAAFQNDATLRDGGNRGRCGRF